VLKIIAIIAISFGRNNKYNNNKKQKRTSLKTLQILGLYYQKLFVIVFYLIFFLSVVILFLAFYFCTFKSQEMRIANHAWSFTFRIFKLSPGIEIYPNVFFFIIYFEKSSLVLKSNNNNNNNTPHQLCRYNIILL